jgi:hypothetical protein
VWQKGVPFRKIQGKEESFEYANLTGWLFFRTWIEKYKKVEHSWHEGMEKGVWQKGVPFRPMIIEPIYNLCLGLGIVVGWLREHTEAAFEVWASFNGRGCLSLRGSVCSVTDFRSRHGSRINRGRRREGFLLLEARLFGEGEGEE